jgi:hypothetical protein
LKELFYQTGRTIHGFEALVVLHSMEYKCSFLKCNSHVIFIWNIALEKCGFLVLLLWVTTALLCLLIATCSITEVLPPLATVNEERQKAECSLNTCFRNSNSFSKDSVTAHLRFFDFSIQLKKSITHSLDIFQTVVKAKVYKCY